MSDSISDPVMRPLVKYRAYPNIITIKEVSLRLHLSIFHPQIKNVLKEIKRFQTNKATQNTDTATKLIKENSNNFADFIFENLNDGISQSVFPSTLKLANIIPVRKKYLKSKKDHYRRNFRMI